MMHLGKMKLATFVLLCGLYALPCEAVAKDQLKAESMTLNQARASIVEAVNENSSPKAPRRIKLRPGGFTLWGAEGSTDNNPIVISFENLQNLGLLKRGNSVYLRGAGSNSGEPLDRGYVQLVFNSKNAASEFYSSVNWFVLHRGDPAVKHLGGGGNLSSEQAAIWRAATPRPTMPEAAHEHQVLAKNAYEEKNFDKAIDEYMAALEIFPTWPEGQNNLAFLCGETGDYDCAIEHAQDYLLLAPDAPNAQAIKDQVIIWKDKLASQQAQAPPPAADPAKKSKTHSSAFGLSQK